MRNLRWFAPTAVLISLETGPQFFCLIFFFRWSRVRLTTRNRLFFQQQGWDAFYEAELVTGYNWFFIQDYSSSFLARASYSSLVTITHSTKLKATVISSVL